MYVRQNYSNFDWLDSEGRYKKCCLTNRDYCLTVFLQLSNSQSEFEQEQELFNHAEMHEGGGDAKRARQKRAQVISEVKLPGS